MPWPALPEHLNTPEKWGGTDHDTKWTRWMLYTKGLTAFGPRVPKQHWTLGLLFVPFLQIPLMVIPLLAKWREWPITLFALRSKQGVFRLETEGWERDSAWENAYEERVIVNDSELWLEGQDKINPDLGFYQQGYLSRCQYYTRWSIQIQWPFLIAVHFYKKATDVPKYGSPRPSGFADGKIWFFYFGAQRNADKFSMFPAGYLGRNWK